MPKPKDYSESAVKLTNPPEVKKLLDEFKLEQDKFTTLNEELKAFNIELVAKIATQSKVVADYDNAIRFAVEEYGSYQDTENERYAVKYARRSKVYDLTNFKQHFPKFVELCVKETIDVTAVEGQVKGKLITVEELERNKVLSYNESYAFYVR